jgi:lipopolysaccharide transport system ATP-binding protein
LSTSSDIAIRASGLSKVYRLYTRHRYRLLDILGLLPRSAGAYREHKALDAVSLDIGRGEKVAIIGRNGAGKSTFMKLVSRVIEPTSGVLEVNARVNALLQIGTGFHPDFTGRENVYAYLAQMGVGGAAADRLFGEVVEFAELEEYIDQPVKTYSSGMGVRLMFSTSTAIEPDLLLLDEVLGVGDAYFAQKSFDRIRQLCSSHGTTLLLVTHDVYAASRLCDRMIWIDRGRVVLDGAGPDVIRAYEDSVRVQEEHRLRTRRLSAMRALVAGAGPADQMIPLLVEVTSASNSPQPCPVYFSAVEIRRDGEVLAALPLTGTPRPDGLSTLQEEATAWGAPLTWQGEPSRPMLNYGSPFHRVAGVLGVPVGGGRGGLEVRLRYWSDQPCDLRLRMYSGSWAADLGRLPDATGRWTDHSVAVHPETDQDPAVVPDANIVGRYGTGDIQILDVGFVERDGSPTEVLRHGEAATLRLRYDIRRPSLRERAQVIIVMHRDGLQDVCRAISRELLFDAAEPAGDLHFTLSRVALTDGRYTVTVMVAEEGYYDRRQTTFFTINPGVYSCLSRAFEVKVIGSGFIGEGTITVEHGDWAHVATGTV